MRKGRGIMLKIWNMRREYKHGKRGRHGGRGREKCNIEDSEHTEGNINAE